jgi:peptide-methionine (S)-S-oxide reductase
MRTHRYGFRTVSLLALLAVPFVLGLSQAPAIAAESATLVPPPQLDQPAPQGAGLEKAVLAGGCFWGVQAVFQHVNGVHQALSGYAGGTKEAASYDTVSAGTTDHAESVEITFDPKAISYGKILQIFFSVAHNPTEVNRQGPDEGPQYRSAIFAQDETQKRVAESYIAQLDSARVFKRRIATKIGTGMTFYPAEAYHQDYATLHPNQPYIVFNDLPKVENLKRVFPDLYRTTPVLVTARASNG